jgi:hypothetical protein
MHTLFGKYLEALEPGEQVRLRRIADREDDAINGATESSAI